MSESIGRVSILVRGAVQGVGFRPFVFRTATALGVTGWVSNGPSGVRIEAEGCADALDALTARLRTDAPPGAVVRSLDVVALPPVGDRVFEIRSSRLDGARSTIILPDLATCPECLRDVQDASNRRYRYPFANCTQCGPRYSIVESVPYDRPRTTMRRFAMCPDCRREYDDPSDRRFHAQPNACPRCGPHLELWDSAGRPVASHDEALRRAADLVCGGAIVAVKGLGGFQLIVDAGQEASVRRLRERKCREEKPLALMLPDAASAEALCEVSAAEREALCSPAAPIVLLRRRAGREVGLDGGLVGADVPRIADSVAPANPSLGVMLPYTPLHHLLMQAMGRPVVATSGNRSDEPMCIDEQEAVERLNGIAEWFLVHDRPIARPVDDSVVQVVLGEAMLLRRARGYAPLPVETAPAETADGGESVRLAVGGHLKNTVALSIDRDVFVSQHVGDLDTAQALDAMQRTLSVLEGLYDRRPDDVLCDLHPDYGSTRVAERRCARSGRSPVRVQHHVAHVFSCLADRGVSPPALGVAWDGAGYGPDGTVWGGEFLRVTGDAIERTASFRPFPLPGGDAAARNPGRTALGALYACLGESAFEMRGLAPVSACSDVELANLRVMLTRGVRCPMTSSVGRLFDAMASLLGVMHKTTFEGQAAMALEWLIAPGVDDAYPARVVKAGCSVGAAAGSWSELPVFAPPAAGQAQIERPSQQAASATGPSERRVSGKNNARSAMSPAAAPKSIVPDNAVPTLIIDWEPWVWAALEDLRRGVSAAVVSARFHNALVEAVVAVAQRVDEPVVALTGGCFQNRYLLERAVARLTREGFRPVRHHQAPTNDGGLSLGQIAAAQWLRARQARQAQQARQAVEQKGGWTCVSASQGASNR